MRSTGPEMTPLRCDTTGPYESALLRLMPSREQGLLLAACLRRGDAAARAWLGFVAEVRDVKVYFETNQTGLKGLLPFVEASLAANGIDGGKAFQTYARVARVREDLRSRIYAEILEAVLTALDAAGISTVLLKAGAVSATVYPQPSTRHNHAIDLLVDAEQMAAASVVLSNAQFTPGPAAPGAAFHRDFRHSTGLALGLHSQLLYLPHFEMPLDEVRARAHVIQIGGRSVAVLSPEDTLVHLCGHATYSRSRANLRWACDAYYLLQRDLNWPLITATASRSRLALPMRVLLGWVNEALAAPLPAEWLTDLHRRGDSVDPVTAEGIYAALLHSTLSRGRAFRAFDTSRKAQFGFLKFSAFPSQRYVSWRHSVDQGWLLPFYYLDRPRRLALRAVAGAARRLTGQRVVAHPDIPVHKKGTA
ncbi:MAG: nucleotidyltransferase family protein [Steroidobacteraceae bacterium]